MPYVLALDQGTTSSRAILFDASGSIVAACQREFQQFFPRPGWVEHDPVEIWTTQLGVAEEVLKAASLTAPDIAAIGITNQRETTVVWDRSTGEPVHPAIVWQDRRTATVCQSLKTDIADRVIREKTGLEIDAYFSGTKIAWILDQIPGGQKRAEAGELAFGTIDTWLLYQLTDGACHGTDASNASRTMLYNLHTGDWDDELLSWLHVPREMLPEVRSSSGIFGHVATSLPLAGIPIGGIAGDQQSALFGQACFTPGQIKNTYGTGCFMLMQTGTEAVVSRNRLLTTVAWETNGNREYALEGSVFIGGAVVGWLRDGLGLIHASSDVESLAQQVDDSGGLYLVPAFAGLGAPHWDPYARGILVGITRGTSPGHIARAALESIAFQVADLADAMQADAGTEIIELRADGGAAANNMLMQLQADILQRPVVRPKIIETTALGAAYLAGLATGIWKDHEEIASHWQMDRRFEPAISPEEAMARRQRWTAAVERSKSWEEG
ncbi:MAG: glycerol kinase GlpK [Pirellulales bacterium]|nr:glycerol kinase GlpK [Pirellulales bacterium]